MLFDPLRMSPESRKDFIALQKRWYKLLKRQGFDDLETLAPNGQFYDPLRYPLKMDLSSPERRAQEKYFSLARAFIYEFTFKSNFEKEVWFNHSEGMPYRKIARAMRATNRRVYCAICRIRKKMMERYLEEQRED